MYTLTSFSFKISNQNPVYANSYVYITIPSELQVGSYSCMYGGVGVACENKTWNSGNAIRVSLANGAVVSAGGLSTITINNIYTPTSTKQTSTFQLSLVFPDGTIS